MNMPIDFSELVSPACMFPHFELDTSSIEIDADKVTFDLAYGVANITCIVVAKTLSEMIEVSSQFDPENGTDKEYTRLELNENSRPTIHKVKYTSVMLNEQIELTSDQLKELNEQLTEIANEQFEQDLAA